MIKNKLKKSSFDTYNQNNRVAGKHEISNMEAADRLGRSVDNSAVNILRHFRGHSY